MMKKYMNVNLPYEILEEVDEHIKKNPFYKSRAEFVKWAIYDKLKSPYKYLE